MHLPAGLFGFPDETEFLLLEVPSTRPLAFVQSVRTQGLCFISLPAQVVMPDYRLELGCDDMQKLGYSMDIPPVMGRDVLCLALLTIREKQMTTANLLAPLVIDIGCHRGVQGLSLAGYSHQHAIPAMEWEHAC